MDVQRNKIHWSPNKHLLGSPSTRRRPPRHSKGQKFLKGPIPLQWLRKAAGLAGRAPLTVALALWYLAGLQNSDTVKLTGKTAKLFHLHPDSVRRGLRNLEAAKLITVTRLPGHTPVVMIMDPEP